jgi:pyruvate/2-oxoglutarate/acetoin dehydrogenase E1 component
MIKNINFIDSINFTIKEIMKKDKSIVLFGLGVDDPKRIFNSTIIYDSF